MKPPVLVLTRHRALQYARIGRAGIGREWPHYCQHLANGPADMLFPRVRHPAFFGCYTWHSAVHTHWMLARLRRLFPRLPVARALDAVLDRHLTPENLATELTYFQAPGRGTFERPYGWAWLLMLAAELRAGRDDASRRWAAAVRPLEKFIGGSVLAWLPRLGRPVRKGSHGNTAFALTLMLDYARAVRNRELEHAITMRSREWFGPDAAVPASWEAGGSDFLSPALAEADLMRRVLPREEFAAWWGRFLPVVPPVLLMPVMAGDRRDANFVLLEGLNLSRAWMLQGIAGSLPPTDPAQALLQAAADRHSAAGLSWVASGNYLGEHWLASYAVRLLT
jgi:hypothetical protein